MPARRSKAAFAATLMAAAASVAAVAQTPPPAGSPGDPELAGAPSPTGSALPADAGPAADIVVTANKREQLSRDVAHSVTAISGEDLERRNEVRLQDLVGQVPGLSIGDETPTQSRIILRGLNAGGVGAQVGSVLDDVPTNPAGAQNNGALLSPDFDTYDLKRIEVLRGPQSSLYGATAEGGLVKYITNPPDPTRFSGSVETGIDGATAGGIGGSTKGFVNIPLFDGTSALRLTAASEWIPGYVDNPDRGKTDSNSAQQYFFRGSFLTQPVEGLTIRLTAQRQSVFGNAADNVQSVGAAATPATPPGNQLDLVHGLTNLAILPTTAQAETGVYYADVNYDFGRVNVTSVTSYTFDNQNVSTDISDQNLAPGLTYAGYLGSTAYKKAAAVSEETRLTDGRFNQEVRLGSDPGFAVAGVPFDWQVGAFYAHETDGLNEVLNAYDAADTNTILSPAAGALGIDAQLSEWALFGQTTLHVTPSVSVDLGGRIAGTSQNSSTFYDMGLLTGASAFRPVIGSNDHDALYTAAPRWQITDDTSVYARVATGYRPGGPNIPTPGIVLPATFKPDSSVNYEAGIKQDLFDKAVQIDVTGFLVHWRQIQVLSVVETSAGPFTVNGNAGTATSKGVEWSLSWRPLPGLRLSDSGAYTDARLTQDSAGIGALTGQNLPFVPDVSNGLNVDYSWTAFEDYEAFVSGTWTYVGGRYTNFSPSTGVVTPHVMLPSYNTGAIRAGFENGRYGFEAFIDNISDERGITTYTNYGGANQTGQVTLIEPRTIGATLRVKF